MTNNSVRKRIVDIYFVLYLAALIFLLPVREENKTGSQDITNPVFHQDFNIYSDKSALNCWLKKDTSGISVVSIDSVNSIFCSGNIENLKFDFVIENQSLFQQVRLSSEKAAFSNFFWYEEDLKNQSATFYWKAPVNEFTNKSYKVYVTATARARNITGSSETKAIVADKVLTARTEFTLNVIFLDRIDEQSNIAANLIDTSGGQFNLQSVQPLFDLQNVDLMPMSSDVKSIANEKWKNDIYVSVPQIGLYFEYPKVNVIRYPDNNGGTALVTELGNNVIKLSGRTPYSGSMKVEVILTSRQSKQKYITEFRVNPQPIGEPEFDKVMNPEISYKIIPKLPLFADIASKVIIRERGTDKERAVSQTGNDFYFSPGFEDIGKTFYLERYINDNLFGQKYIIEVKDYSEPQIVKLTPGDNKVKVETRSFGIFQGRENLVKYLEIDGNGRYREDFGKPTEGKDKHSYIQYFYITPKQSDKPFRFTVKAIDMRDRSSEIKSYQQ